MVSSRIATGQEGSGGAIHLPPFLTKTYEIVDDPKTDEIVAWNPKGTSFVVWKPAEFARDLLPLHFKHNNFSSFVRQLNTYGFRKTHPDRWEFANDNFLKGHRDLLKSIHRKKSASFQAASENSQSGALVHSSTAIERGSHSCLREEIEALKKWKNVLMMELMRQRQQQQWTGNEIRQMAKRVEMAEGRQAEMLRLFSSFLKNPKLLTQMLQAANRHQEKLKSTKSPGQKRKRAQGDEGEVDAMGDNMDVSNGPRDKRLMQYSRSDGKSPELSDALLSLVDTLVDGSAFRDRPQDRTEFSPGVRVEEPGQGDAPVNYRGHPLSSPGTELEASRLGFGTPVDLVSPDTKDCGMIEGDASSPFVYSDLANYHTCNVANTEPFPFTNLSNSQSDLVFSKLDTGPGPPPAAPSIVSTGMEVMAGANTCRAEGNPAFDVGGSHLAGASSTEQGIVSPFALESSVPLPSSCMPPKENESPVDLFGAMPSLKSVELTMLDSDGLLNTFHVGDPFWEEPLILSDDSGGIVDLKVEGSQGS